MTTLRVQESGHNRIRPCMPRQESLPPFVDVPNSLSPNSPKVVCNLHVGCSSLQRIKHSYYVARSTMFASCSAPQTSYCLPVFILCAPLQMHGNLLRYCKQPDIWDLDKRGSTIMTSCSVYRLSWQPAWLWHWTSDKYYLLWCVIIDLLDLNTDFHVYSWTHVPSGRHTYSTQVRSNELFWTWFIMIFWWIIY